MNTLMLYLLFILIPKLVFPLFLATAFCFASSIGNVAGCLSKNDDLKYSYHNGTFTAETELKEDINKNNEIFLNKFKKNILYGFIFLILSLCVPSQNEMAMLYITPKVLNNTEIQKLPINFIKYLNNLLTEDKIK